jgi:hypothetical protein
MLIFGHRGGHSQPYSGRHGDTTRRPFAVAATVPGEHQAQGTKQFQVRVRAGTDPVTGKPLHLHGSAATQKDAEKLLTKLLSEADQERAASTKASLGIRHFPGQGDQPRQRLILKRHL